jgi:hypothetical protein
MGSMLKEAAFLSLGEAFSLDPRCWKAAPTDKKATAQIFSQNEKIRVRGSGFPLPRREKPEEEETHHSNQHNDGLLLIVSKLMSGAGAGIQLFQAALDPGVRRSDGLKDFFLRARQ